MATVHICGAGFSHAAGFPLCAHLLREIDRFMLHEYQSDYEKIYGKDQMWMAFKEGFWDQIREELTTSELLKHFITVDADGLLNGNIERVLDVIDRSLAEKENANDPFNLMFSRTTRWRFGLVHTLAFYFRAMCLRLEKDNPAAARPIMDYVLRFVDAGDTIITFNYDNLVERILFSARVLTPSSSIRWTHGDGYGFDLPTMYLLAGADQAEVHKDLVAVDKEVVSMKCSIGSNVKLLYLHGSAFWTWESDVSRLVMSAALMWRKVKPESPVIVDLSRPVMAEPRSEKPLGIAVLPEIWKSASEALRSADQVMVIGYSFPEADGAAERLIQDALNDSNAEITIVDPAPVADHRIVKILSKKVDYVQATLQTFLKTAQPAAYRRNAEPKESHSCSWEMDCKCVGCGDVSNRNIWLIVDMQERPDLVAAFRAGSLHGAPCPKCGQLVTAPAPLLLFRPSESPALLFSPHPGTPFGEQFRQVDYLTGQLQQRMGKAWREHWLADRVAILRRDDVEAFFDGTQKYGNDEPSLTVQVICHNCAQAYEFNLWLIIDVPAQPELVKRICEGTLHDSDCLHCKQSQTTHMPLLLYRAHEHFPVLFSPAPESTLELRREHATWLLNRLRHQLIDDFREGWLSAGLDYISRKQLPNLLGGAADASTLIGKIAL